MSEVTIRPAHVGDVPRMAQLINDSAEYGLMLPRSLESLYENVRDFHVGADARGTVVGVCGLGVVWANLAEVYSLVVSSEHRGEGLGGRLVKRCVEEAEQLGVRRLMTLTYQRAFFERLGFNVVDRQQLPLKVWSECVHCPKNKACDEIAMIHELAHVPEAAAPQPEAPPAERYIIPITRSVGRRRATVPPAKSDY